ncbi:MAG: ribosome maturation factor RimM [Cycloclasticus sp.]|nr:MAG: ribosome maturation factor RimM [Cycloclasticus sp. Phe_18]MDF1688601.1 ribosome maturation factor RimM [Cycloclasticus sp.]MEE4291532.1 ribosome maturation factor RimM [Cycloclasticus sp.]
MSESTQAEQLGKESRWLKLGNISGVFGVKGWLKVYANTDKKENILSYQPWYIERNKVRQAVKLKAGKPHGKTIIVQLDGVDDRNEAELWVGSDIYMKSDQLPKLSKGEYYWSDLIGLQVVSTNGEEFGVIDQMLETGANDVIVVKGDRERLIPYVTEQVVKSVDLDKQQMIVDWDADF